MFFFFFKQKTAYEMRISDWSSDVCSSDLCDYADCTYPSATKTCTPHPPNHSSSSCAHASIPTTALAQHIPDDRLPGYANALEAVFTIASQRSEERRVGKECVRTCRSRWSPYH